MEKTMNRRSYATDLTDAQWEVLAPFIPKISPNTTCPTIARREIVNGILYVLRTGCSWRLAPHDLPNGKTLYHSFRQWKLSGVWENAMTNLRKQARQAIGRDEEPSAVIIDSQSIKTSPVRGIERGFDAGKKESCPCRAPSGMKEDILEQKEVRPRTTHTDFMDSNVRKKLFPGAFLNRQLLLIRGST